MMMDNPPWPRIRPPSRGRGRARIDERPANATFRVIKTTSRAGILKECTPGLTRQQGNSRARSAGSVAANQAKPFVTPRPSGGHATNQDAPLGSLEKQPTAPVQVFLMLSA